MPTREAVFSALLTALTNGVPGLTTYSRRMQLPGNMSPGILPALLLREEFEVIENKGNLVNRVWDATIFLVFRNTSQTVPGATIINPLLELVEAALAPDDRAHNTFTLGGLVHYARIEGRIVIESGDVDATGLGGAIIPLKLRIP